MDEQHKDAEEYLKSHKIPTIMQSMISNVLYTRPGIHHHSSMTSRRSDVVYGAATPTTQEIQSWKGWYGEWRRSVQMLMPESFRWSSLTSLTWWRCSKAWTWTNLDSFLCINMQKVVSNPRPLSHCHDFHHVLVSDAWHWDNRIQPEAKWSWIERNQNESVCGGGVSSFHNSRIRHNALCKALE